MKSVSVNFLLIPFVSIVCSSYSWSQCLVELCVDFGCEAAPSLSLVSYLWGFVETQNEAYSSTEDLYLHLPGAGGHQLGICLN